MNTNQTMCLTNVLRLTLATLLDYGRMCNVDVSRDVVELETRVVNEGQHFVTRALLAFGKDLRCAIDKGRCSSGMFRGFKRIRHGGYPYFLQGFLERIFDRSGEILPRDQVDAKCFQAVYQICLSWYKHEVSCPEDIVRKQYSDYLLLDDTIQCSNEPEGPFTQEKVIRYGMHAVLSRVLAGLNVNETNFFPAHGSGCTSEGLKTPSQKWEFVYDHLLENETLYPDLSPVQRRIWEKEPRINRSGFVFNELTAVATLTDVPKDSGGQRLIFKEATSSMMYQQTVFSVIVNHLEHNEFTRGQINFTDQTINQRLALESSSSSQGHWATIDWKEASDRVAWHEVQNTFPSSFVELVKKGRTQYFTIPEDKDPLDQWDRSVRRLKHSYVGVDPLYTKYRGVRVVRHSVTYERFWIQRRPVYVLKKHAPMGSALCFPVMAMYIWAGAVQRIMKELVMNGECERNVFKHACSLVYVYGDDLIVPSEMAQPIIADLELLGMLANRSKTFTQAARGNVFRESCGVDTINGVDVTPVKFKAVFPLDQYDISSVESWVEYTNRLAELGCLQAVQVSHSIVHAAVGERLIGLLHNTDNPDAICFSRLVSSLTGWDKLLYPSPRWNQHLQCYERECITSQPAQSFIKSTPKTESVQLMRWLAERDPQQSYHQLPFDAFEARGYLLDDASFMAKIHFDHALPESSGLKRVYENGAKKDKQGKPVKKFTGWMEDDPKSNIFKCSMKWFPPLTY